MPNKREPCAPALPTADDGSVAVDNLTKSDRHQRRTVIDVDTGRIEAEQIIAAEARRERKRERRLLIFLIVGAYCGIGALLIEAFRIFLEYGL